MKVSVKAKDFDLEKPLWEFDYFIDQEQFIESIIEVIGKYSYCLFIFIYWNLSLFRNVIWKNKSSFVARAKPLFIAHVWIWVKLCNSRDCNLQ